MAYQAWNKGLTKSTDHRVAKYAEKKKEWHHDPANKAIKEEIGRKIGESRKGISSWNKGLTKETDERVRLGGERVSKTRKVKKWCSWDKGKSGDPSSPNYDSRLNFMIGDSNPAKRPEVRKKISDSSKVHFNQTHQRSKLSYCNWKKNN